MAAPDSPLPPVDVHRTGSLVCAGLTVWTLFVAMSFMRAPIPAVNEPHYLGKAKYWWDPGWCTGDFFLQSSNPHAVFYASIGWLTRWLTLPQTAAVARVFAFGLLASGWVYLARALGLRSLTSVAAATLFCLLMAVGNFSGEWLIGGIESKVFAYAAALWGGGAWLSGRPVPGAALTAVAVAYHPVAGAWVVAAVMVTGAWNLARNWRGYHVTARDWTALVILLAGSLLALSPALPLVLGVDPAVGHEADRILLTQRVGHHTDPLLFSRSAYVYYSGLLVVWLVTTWRHRGHPRWHQWQQFVAASLLFFAVALLIGWLPEFTVVDRLAPWRLWLLKFYPFRLADLTLPMGVALGLCRELDRPYRVTAPQRGLLSNAAPAVMVAVAATLLMLWWPAPDANSSSMSASDRDDWINTCMWLGTATPPESLIATANEDWAVKWFSNRPEYVNFKDCPQDAAGVLEWWRRRQALVSWSRVAKADGTISAADLAELQAKTGVDYLLVSRFGPIEPAPVYEQGPFRVYALQR